MIKKYILFLTLCTLQTITKPSSIREQIRAAAKKERELAKEYEEKTEKAPAHSEKRRNLYQESLSHNFLAYQVEQLGECMDNDSKKDNLQGMLECYNKNMCYNNDSVVIDKDLEKIIIDILSKNTNNKS